MYPISQLTAVLPLLFANMLSAMQFSATDNASVGAVTLVELVDPCGGDCSTSTRQSEILTLFDQSLNVPGGAADVTIQVDMMLTCTTADCDPMIVLADGSSAWMGLAEDGGGGHFYADGLPSWTPGQQYNSNTYTRSYVGGWPNVVGEQILSTVCFRIHGGQTTVSTVVNGHSSSENPTFSGAAQLDHVRLSLYGGDPEERWRFSVIRVSQTDQCAQPTSLSPSPTTSATGDPHLQNIHGEQFDLMRPGRALLINIPRGKVGEDALLVVQADAKQLGGRCADTYFQQVNITGAWVDKTQNGSHFFDVHAERNLRATWDKYGPVELKVVRGLTNSGIRYFNIYAKHLGHAGFPVGGLLGEDDHAEAATTEGYCHTRVSLSKNAPLKGEGVHASVAVGSLI